MLVETYSECFDACAKILFFTEIVERPDEMEKFRRGLLTNFMKLCENELQGNSFSKFIVGEHLTIADVCIASFAFNILNNEAGPFQEKFAPYLVMYPFFSAYIKRMETEFSV